MSASGNRMLALEPWVAKRHLDRMPRAACHGKDSTWWDTGNEGNLQAFAICAGCPLPALGRCRPYPGITGVIVAGVAYDDRSRALRRCPGCWFPMPISSEHPKGECKRRSCSTNGALPAHLDSNRPRDYRLQITEMTLAGVTRREICVRLNLRERGVRHAQERWELTGVKLAARRAAMGAADLAALRERWLTPGPTTTLGEAA